MTGHAFWKYFYAVTGRMGWRGMKLGGEDEMSKLKNQAGQ